MSYPYHGEDFCLIHGREHMRSAMGNPIPWCEACEDEREPSTISANVETGQRSENDTGHI